MPSLRRRGLARAFCERSEWRGCRRELHTPRAGRPLQEVSNGEQGHVVRSCKSSSAANGAEMDYTRNGRRGVWRRKQVRFKFDCMKGVLAKISLYCCSCDEYFGPLIAMSEFTLKIYQKISYSTWALITNLHHLNSRTGNDPTSANKILITESCHEEGTKE
jgi:hypothetical protein